MLVALFLAVTAQSSGPMLPAGSNPDLHRGFNLVAESLSNGEFEQAKARSRLLPRFAVGYQWDDSKIPVGHRAEWIAARNLAFKTLSGSIAGLSFKQSSQPAIRFGFEKNLAADPDSGLPRGVALFFSEAPSEPRMEAVLGLFRGNPLEKASSVSIHNEIMFAVGSYLGLAQSPLLGTVMGRTDLQMQQYSVLDVTELGTLEYVRTAAKRMDSAVQKKERLSQSNPKASFDPVTIERGPVIQGEPIEFSVQVSNTGDAPLQFRVLPDCGCVTAGLSPIVPPGSSVAVPIKVDTKDITTELNRHLILISNDSTKPIQRFPIRIRTFPRYQILTQQPNVLIVEENGLDTEVFIVSPTEKPLEILSIDVNGNPGKATFEPWQGVMAGPGAKDPPIPRAGYRVSVHLDEPQVSGRSMATLVIKTSDPSFATIRHTMFAQRGIAIMPASIYLGDVDRAVREASILLSRPNRPFKIISLESDSSFLSATAVAMKGGSEYKIICKYNGKAPQGDLRGTLTIQTDDRRQAKIRVPVMGIVR